MTGNKDLEAFLGLHTVKQFYVGRKAVTRQVTRQLVPKDVRRQDGGIEMFHRHGVFGIHQYMEARLGVGIRIGGYSAEGTHFHGTPNQGTAHGTEAAQITLQQLFHPLLMQISRKDEHAVVHPQEAVFEISLGLLARFVGQGRCQFVGAVGIVRIQFPEKFPRDVLAGHLLLPAVEIKFGRSQFPLIGHSQERLQQQAQSVRRRASADIHAAQRHVGFHRDAVGRQQVPEGGGGHSRHVAQLQQ